jgi:hypothetical protein
MTASTILTMANGKGVDLLNVRVEDIDFRAIAEQLGKEKRFNGATPQCEYSVGQHSVLGTEQIIRDGGTDLDAAYFLLHDAKEFIWKDDTTPKKRALAYRISQRCGVLAEDILKIINGVEDDIDAVIHEAAGLPYPLAPEHARIVKLYDLRMFVTEWRDLMGGIEHPNPKPYENIKPLAERIAIPCWSWAWAEIRWTQLARKLLPALAAGRAA